MKQKLTGLLQMYKDMSVAVKAAIWFTICNVVNAGLVVLSTPIFTRLMTQTEYGAYNTFFAWRGVLVIFTSLNLSYGVFNNAMVRYEDSKTRDEYVSSMQGLYTVITAAWLTLYLFTST